MEAALRSALRYQLENLPYQPSHESCLPCLAQLLDSWHMDCAFTIPKCPHFEANNIDYLRVHAIPRGAAHMHFELLAHIHYMVGIWETSGPPSEPELCRAAGNLLWRLIHDFIAAVTEHRQVWHIEARRATEETMLAYEQCYDEAKARMPAEYRHIRPKPDTGRPGVLFARSFKEPVMSLSLDLALRFQRKQRSFLSRICSLIRSYDESMPSSFDEFYESGATTWKRHAPTIERDLHRG